SCSALRETPLAGHRPADGPPVESYAEAMWVLSGGPVSGDVADWNAASWISVGPPPRAPARVRAIRIRGRLLLSWIRPG
ncbi:MAG: hypothetical protein H0V67_01970, partial [Geodermatophilaceae bacterium]|nr:hypothetical protein [Geodermatophilaceae bacterium]